jgi:hypothetical protein
MTTMSKHETVLALTQEYIEKEEKTLSELNVKMMRQRADLERTEKEAKLSQWTLDELRTTRELLSRDRSMGDHPTFPPAA